MHYLMIIAIFLTVVLVIEGGYLACRALYAPERRRVRRRLHTLTVQDHDDTPVGIVRSRALSEVAWVNDLLGQIPLIPRLGRLLEQANSRYKIGTFLGFSAALGCLGLLVGPFVIRNVYGQILGSIV